MTTLLNLKCLSEKKMVLKKRKQEPLKKRKKEVGGASRVYEGEDDGLHRHDREQRKPKRDDDGGFLQFLAGGGGDASSSSTPTLSTSSAKHANEEHTPTLGKREREEEDEEDVDGTGSSDDEEEDEEDMEEEEGNANERKPVHRSTSSNAYLYRPPTAEEASAMRETQALFSSNVIKLQFTELLKEVGVEYRECRLEVEPQLRALQESLMAALPATVLSMSKKDAKTLVKQTLPVSNQMIPLPLSGHRGKGVDGEYVIRNQSTIQAFRVAAPEKFSLVGSYLRHMLAKPMLNVDVAVTMPSVCLEPDDVKQYRYLDKRLVYLAAIAKHLNSVLVSSGPLHEAFLPQYSIENFRGGRRKPVLVLYLRHQGVQTADGGTAHFRVRILVTYPANAFRFNQLLPGQCNVVCTGGQKRPTPHYNSCVREDALLEAHMRVCAAVLSKSPSFVEAGVLARVWLYQRHNSAAHSLEKFEHAHDGLNGFLVDMLLVHLATQRLIVPSMSNFQVLRFLMHFLVNTDFKKGVSFMNENGEMLSEEGLDRFRSAFDCTFVDPTHSLNLFSRLTNESMKMIKDDAKNCVRWLDMTTGLEGFASVFTTRLHPSRVYDAIIRVQGVKCSDNGTDSFATPELCDQEWRLQTANAMCQTLRRALTDRVDVVRVLQDGPEDWMFGLLLNAENMTRLVDKGPSGDSKAEGEEFKKFWGEKAEMRRFKDGAIVHSVVWDRPVLQRHLIVADIAKFILPLHHGGVVDILGLEETDEALAAVSPLRSVANVDISTVFMSIQSAYNHLSTTLRELKDLPLPVESLSPASPHLRYTSVIPPLPNQRASASLVGDCPASSKCHTDPIEVVVELERSLKWPGNLEAVRQCRQRFQVSLADELAKVGVRCTLTNDFVDVDRDAGRHLMALQKDGVLFSNIVHRAATTFSSFSKAVRLTKRWLHANLLTDLVRDELVEVLACSVYASSATANGCGPYTRTPATAEAAFCRILSLLVTHPWDTAPLIVDLDGDISALDHAKLQSNFETLSSNRRSTTPMHVSFGLRHPLTALLPSLSPTREVFGRLIQLASTTLSSLETTLHADHTTGSALVHSFFRPALASFDAALHLHHSESHMLNPHAESVGLFVGLHPAESLVRELRWRLGDAALFMWDGDKRSEIYIAFRPKSFLPRFISATYAITSMPISLSLSSPPPVAASSTSTSRNGKHLWSRDCVVNVFDLFAEMQALGEGIIKRVDYDLDAKLR